MKYLKIIRSTEVPNNNDIKNDGLAAPTRKKKFPTNTTPFKLGSTDTEFNKWKNSSPIIHELNTPVNNKAIEGFSSKPSSVDFNIVMDKPFKQESPSSSKIRTTLWLKLSKPWNILMNKLTQERKSKLLQQKIPITEITTLYSKTKKNDGKVLHWLILGDSAISWLIEKKMFRNRKTKVRYFPRVKLKTSTTVQFLY